MTEPFDDAVKHLARVFPGTKVLKVPDRRLVLIPNVMLEGAEWTPDRIRTLLVCDDWPQVVPRLLISDDVRRAGNEPSGFSKECVADEPWFSYSYTFQWDPARPNLARAVDAWLQRFDGRP